MIEFVGCGEQWMGKVRQNPLQPIILEKYRLQLDHSHKATTQLLRSLLFEDLELDNTQVSEDHHHMRETHLVKSRLTTHDDILRAHSLYCDNPPDT